MFYNPNCKLNFLAENQDDDFSFVDLSVKILYYFNERNK